MKKFAVLALALMPFFFTSCEKSRNYFSGKWGTVETHSLGDAQKVDAILNFESVLNGADGEVTFELRKTIDKEVLKTIWTGTYHNDGTQATDITMTKMLKNDLNLSGTEFPEKWKGSCTQKGIRVWLTTNELIPSEGGIVKWEFWSEYDFDE